jgi:hypothetical protein
MMTSLPAPFKWNLRDGIQVVSETVHHPDSWDCPSWEQHVASVRKSRGRLQVHLQEKSPNANLDTSKNSRMKAGVQHASDIEMRGSRYRKIHAYTCKQYRKER